MDLTDSSSSQFPLPQRVQISGDVSDQDLDVSVPIEALPAQVVGSVDCKICVLRLESPAKLVEHLYSHMGKRYACSLCPDTFLAEADLLAHVYALHAHA